MSRSGLLRAWLFVVGFWWIVGLVYLEAVGTKNFISQLVEVATSFDVEKLIGQDKNEAQKSLPESESSQTPDHAPGSQAEDAQQITESQAPQLNFWSVIERMQQFSWTASSLILMALIAMLTSLHLFTWGLLQKKSIAKRIDADPEWRGIGANIGELKPVSWYQKLPAFNSTSVNFKSIGVDADEAKRVQRLFDDLPARYQAIIRDVFWLLSEYNDSFVGHGHAQEDEDYALLNHAIRVVCNGWRDNSDSLLPIILVAHDLGKIPVWKNKGFDSKSRLWSDKGYHDDRSGLILSSLDSFEALDEEEQLILLLIVRYSHKSGLMPRLPTDEANRRAGSLMEKLKNTDRQTTSKEKEVVVKSITENEYIEAFWKCLDDLTWANKNLPRGIKANAWRVGDECYILEVNLRNIYLSRLGPNISAAFNNGHRNQGKPAQITSHLLDLLKSKNLLVLQKNGHDLHPNNLWNINVGKAFAFRGVIGLRLPKDKIEFPETHFDVQVYPFDSNIDDPESIKAIQSSAAKTDVEKSSSFNAAIMGVPVKKLKTDGKTNSPRQTRGESAPITNPKATESTISKKIDSSVSDSEKIKQKALKSHNEDSSTADDSLNSIVTASESSSKGTREKISELTDKTQQKAKKVQHKSPQGTAKSSPKEIPSINADAPQHQPTKKEPRQRNPNEHKHTKAENRDQKSESITLKPLEKTKRDIKIPDDLDIFAMEP